MKLKPVPLAGRTKRRAPLAPLAIQVKRAHRAAIAELHRAAIANSSTNYLQRVTRMAQSLLTAVESMQECLETASVARGLPRNRKGGLA